MWVSLVLFLRAGVTRSETPGTAALHVTGELRSEEKLEETARGFRVSGKITDELGLPRANAELSSARVLTTCAMTETSLPDARPPVVSDADGNFCFDVEAQRGEKLIFQVRAADHETLSREVSLSGSTDAPPRFVRAPAVVDQASRALEVIEVLVPKTRDEVRSGTLELAVRVTGDRFTLETRPLHEGELARFELRGDVFPKVGPAELEATWTVLDAPTRGATPRALDVQSTVKIEFEDANPSTSGVIVHLRVVTARGVAESGLVELRDEKDEFLGSADVHDGRTVIALRRQETEQRVTARYVPTSPHLLPGESLAFDLPASRSALLPWLVHGSLIIAFVCWLWLRWRRSADASRLGEVVLPPGRAVVKTRGPRRGPLAGIVLDAHTGEPVANAALELRATDVDAERVIETTASGPDGRFEMKTSRDGAGLLRLVVDGPRHMRLEALVSTGQLDVHVTERRRAGLLALVRWARQPGSPWNRQRAPTPGDVERAAVERNAPEEAAWAARVAGTVYGPEAPTEEQIQELASTSTSRSSR